MTVRFIAFCALPPLLGAARDHGSIPPDPERLPPVVREITIDETDKLIRENKDAAVIDVRTADEFAEDGHLPRAQLVDFFREDFKAAIGTLKLDPSKPCVVYCAVGGRARRAAGIMAQLGFKNIRLPKGSFLAWKDAGKPVEGGPRK